MLLYIDIQNFKMFNSKSSFAFNPYTPKYNNETSHKYTYHRTIHHNLLQKRRDLICDNIHKKNKK